MKYEAFAHESIRKNQRSTKLDKVFIGLLHVLKPCDKILQNQGIKHEVFLMMGARDFLLRKAVPSASRHSVVVVFNKRLRLAKLAGGLASSMLT